MTNKKEIDITELIENGDVKTTLEFMQEAYKKGYDKIYFDGYDAAIYMYRGI